MSNRESINVFITVTIGRDYGARNVFPELCPAIAIRRQSCGGRLYTVDRITACNLLDDAIEQDLTRRGNGKQRGIVNAHRAHVRNLATDLRIKTRFDFLPPADADLVSRQPIIAAFLDRVAKEVAK